MAMDMKEKPTRLSVLSFGLAFGTITAITMFVIGLSAWLIDWGTPVVKLVGSMYLGYEPSLMGSIIGALYGFVDWFIGGILIAWFYNIYLGLLCCPKSGHRGEGQN